MEYRNPVPTVDIIIEIRLNVDSNIEYKGIVLIKRKNPPYGWAIPGGFVDYGESVETAAKREALEETGLNVDELKQFHVYSDPERDARLHTISTVFTAKASQIPCAGDDACEAKIFNQSNLPEDIAFDHAAILDDYFNHKY